MSATELVTVQHQHAAAPRQVRISRRVKVAIDHMVHRGQKRAEAATNAGITDEAMRKAMHKPEVLVYLDTQQQVLRTSAKARSIARIDNLADDAASEHVKLESNKFLLGIEGVSVVTKSENTNINKNMTPGLTINLLVQTGTEPIAQQIDSQVRQLETTSHINVLPRPVPHPSMGNAQKTEGLPAKTEGLAPAPEGAK